MGAVISRFKKEKTTYQILENLEENIKTIEAYTISTQRRQKRIVGNFLVISVGLYVILAFVFYFAFFPPTWIERITYSMPLLLFPLIIILLKKLVAWYFQRKVNSNSNKLSDLKAEKKKILEKVMDKETYKVALELLNRFGDKPGTYRAQSQSTPVAAPRPSTVITSPTPPPQIIPRQQMSTNNRNYSGPTTLWTSGRSISSVDGSTPVNHNRSIMLNDSNRLNNQQRTQMPVPSPRNNPSTPSYNSQQRGKTPFPIIDLNNKGVLEKMVDYFIGDGYRFAMICKECHRHNGMSLEEEFYYSSFSCAYCNTLNPARKLRPQAPKLVLPSNIRGANSESEQKNSSTSTSEKDSDSGSEVEADKKVTNTLNNVEQILENNELANEQNIEQTDDVPQENDKSDIEKKKD